MVDKSELAIATSQTQNPIPFLIELLFNLLSQMITTCTIKLTCHPVRKFPLFRCPESSKIKLNPFLNW
jgi:hypothetical protein